MRYQCHLSTIERSVSYVRVWFKSENLLNRISDFMVLLMSIDSDLAHNYRQNVPSFSIAPNTEVQRTLNLNILKYRERRCGWSKSQHVQRPQEACTILKSSFDRSKVAKGSFQGGKTQSLAEVSSQRTNTPQKSSSIPLPDNPLISLDCTWGTG